MTDQHMKTLTEELHDDPELRNQTEREWFIDGAIIQIEQAMKNKGITRKQLADRLECSAPNVTQLLRHGSNLTLGTLMDIALALEHRFLTPEMVSLSVRAPWECSGSDGASVVVKWEAEGAAPASKAWTFPAFEAGAALLAIYVPYSTAPSGVTDAY